MATITYLDIDQGSDFSAIIDLQNDAGTAMNLSGMEVYSQFRKSYNSAVGYSFTCAIENALNGTISLKLPGETSSNIKSGRYLYDIVIVDPMQDIKTRVIEGIITIHPEVTKTP